LGIWSSSILSFAQSLPSTVPLAAQEKFAAGHGLLGISWQFDLSGKKYAAQLSREQIASAPDWNSTSPLPLTLAKAEELARAELRKRVVDDSNWEVTELGLHRLRGEVRPKWYFLVQLMQKKRESSVIPDVFILPITFAGETGKINVITP